MKLGYKESLSLNGAPLTAVIWMSLSVNNSLEMMFSGCTSHVQSLFQYLNQAAPDLAAEKHSSNTDLVRHIDSTGVGRPGSSKSSSFPTKTDFLDSGLCQMLAFSLGALSQGDEWRQGSCYRSTG